MVEIKNSINWYLVKINKSIAAIETFKPPVNYDELRFQYSILIESMFSLIDYIEDKKTIFNNSKFEIEGKIKKEIGSEGNIIMDYMRELRNSIIHRGEDVASAGNVINGRFAILAPDNVTNRSGNLIEKPKDVFLDKLISILDNATKNVTKSELHRLNVLEESNVQSINDLATRIKNIPIPHHAPDEVKMMIKAHREKTLEEDFFSMATDLYNASLINLKGNLDIRMNIQHLS
ncbi:MULTISPECIES: hypothetical protein [Serratia]|uniref:hypothetical protein n=1 Tax=Serratia TaxID=613 RepID=UPI0029DA8E02|nr:hypothetical protein [Serratia marcescens]MDX7544982.1 hypothetical protein [Serratia marcescens]MDX7564185.1 hypothetical protein [Serratia marcescens]